MNPGYVEGLLAAVGAALLYGSAPVAQAGVAARAPVGRGVGLRLVLRLVLRPVWLLGLVGEVGGFLLEAFAFSTAPATLVAPVASCDLLVFVLLAAAFLGTPRSARVWSGAGAMAGGAALLAVALSGHAHLGRPATDAELGLFMAGCIVAVAVAAVAGQRSLAAERPGRAAFAFSAGAGVCYGLATLVTRQVGRTFSTAHPVHLLATPTPYVLAVCSLLGIAMMQRGLQARPLITYPITSGASAFLPVVVGVLLLDDPAPANGRRIAFVAALVLIAVGVALLGRDRDAEGGGARKIDGHRVGPAAGGSEDVDGIGRGPTRG